MLASCAPSIRVFSDYDKDANISDYKTYTWVTEEEIEGKSTNPLYCNELNDKLIKHAVYEQMKNRGFAFEMISSLLNCIIILSLKTKLIL